MTNDGQSLVTIAHYKDVLLIKAIAMTVLRALLLRLIGVTRCYIVLFIVMYTGVTLEPVL